MGRDADGASALWTQLKSQRQEGKLHLKDQGSCITPKRDIHRSEKKTLQGHPEATSCMLCRPSCRRAPGVGRSVSALRRNKILLLQPALQLYVTKLARAMGGGGSWSSPKAGSHLRERARLSLLPDWCGFKPARQEAGQRSPRHGHYYTTAWYTTTVGTGTYNVYRY